MISFKPPIYPFQIYEYTRVAPKARVAYSTSTIIFMVLVWLGGCWGDLRQGLEWTNLLGPALISPLAVGLASLGTTILLYLLVLILRDQDARPSSFKTLYSLNLHCGIIFLLGEVVNFLLVRTNLLGDHATPLRGRFPLGLDVFLLNVDDPNIYLSIVLHSTSVFLIWYLVVLSTAVRLFSGITKTRATLIVIAYWGILVLLALAAAHAAGGETVIRVRL